MVDSVNSFIVQQDWLTSIEKLDIETQDKIIADLIRYGVNLEPKHQDEPIVESFVNLIKGRIDYSKGKYAEKVNMSKTAGRKTKVDHQKVWQLAHDEGKKANEIAEILEISESSVNHSEGWKNRDKDNYFNF